MQVQDTEHKQRYHEHMITKTNIGTKMNIIVNKHALRSNTKHMRCNLRVSQDAAGQVVMSPCISSRDLGYLPDRVSSIAGCCTEQPYICSLIRTPSRPSRSKLRRWIWGCKTCVMHRFQLLEARHNGGPTLERVCFLLQRCAWYSAVNEAARRGLVL
jgi:hypothetical protein